MSLLDRKLRRDIVAMRGQVLTIALLVAAGVAVFVGSVSTYDSLNSAVEHFYATARFPRLFVTLKRAPLSIVPQLTAIPGVATVEPRIVREVIVDWPARFAAGLGSHGVAQPCRRRTACPTAFAPRRGARARFRKKRGGQRSVCRSQRRESR
ncbi:hypothetical protein [Bradyrhizobium diazoefficiens]